MTDGQTDAGKWRSVAIEEYKSLREESLQAQRQHHSALQLGFSGLAVLVGLSVALHDRTVAAVVLLTAVPLLVTATVLIWLNELRRMVRAGAFLVEAERRLNRSLPGTTPAVSWETTLRRGAGPQTRLTNLYRAIFAILLGLYGIAAVAGMWLLVALHAGLLLLIVIPVELSGGLRLLDLFARFEVVLHDAGRGDYEGADFTMPRADLAWPRLFQSLLDAFATARRQELLPRAECRAPRLSLFMLACGGLMGRYPQWVLPEGPDCIVAFSFGFPESTQDRAPGSSNDQLAIVVAETNPGLPMVLQEEVARALGLREHPDTVLSTSRGGRYMDTRAVAVAMSSRIARQGLGRALVVAHPHHVARACSELLSLGVQCEPAARLTHVGFDPDSAQIWTRRRSSWIAREVLVVLIHPARRLLRRIRSCRRSRPHQLSS
jgi:hypothetical protein